MLCVAVCDDEELVCTGIEKMMEPYRKSGLLQSEIFFSGEKLWEALERGEHYDLLFLDIELRNMNGVEVGKKIRDELGNETIRIVYISAKQDYAMELFNVRPMNFLVKPISEEAVLENIRKAMELTDINKTCFEYKFRKQTFKVPYGDILYFESEHRKILIHTKTGLKETYGSLSELEKETPEGFIRIHQSYLVNWIYVTHWKYDAVHIKQEHILPVSRTYRKNVSSFLLQNS